MSCKSKIFKYICTSCKATFFCCEKVGIKFLTTCCDKERVDFLSNLPMECIKVARPDSTDDVIVEALRSNFDRVIVSTGMTTNDEVGNIINKFNSGKQNLSSYTSS